MNTNNTVDVVKRLGGWLIAGLMGLMVASANAGVLLQQAPLDNGTGFYSSIGGGVQNADNFVFGAAVKLDGIGWWGSYSDDQGDDFVVRIFSDNSGSPDTAPLNEFNQVATKSSTSLMDDAGQTVSYYEIALSPLDLQAGTYYLSIMNEQGVWNWLEADAGNGNNWWRIADGDPWDLDQTFDFSFALMGNRVTNVPEPSSLALLGIAGLSMVLAGRRRQQQAA